MHIDELKLNSNRIHDDRSCADGVEDYNGLVVHARSIATLRLDLRRQFMPAARVSEFSLRAARPSIDTSSVSVCGDRQLDGSIRRWAQDAAGCRATTTTALVA